MRSSGQGTILEAFKPGTAPPDSYAGDASPRALNGMGDADRMIGSGTGGLY
jgi:penicillin-binding protein 1A